MLDCIKSLKEKNRKNNMTKTYNELTKFFNMELDILAQKLKYSNDNILILRGDEENLKTYYTEIYRNTGIYTHFLVWR